MHVHIESNEKERLQEATTIIAAGGVTNGILGIVKVALGSITGYLPLTASGVHSLSDIVSDVVAWVAVRMGSQSEKQGGDVRFHYGRRRIETLLALFAAFLLVFVSVELIMSAFGYHDHGHGMPTAIVEEAETHGIDDHDHEHAAEHGEEDLGHLLFLVGGVILVSVIAKEVLFRVTRRKGIRLNSPMLIAKAWHHRADSISALAVLLSIFISSYFPALSLINPITTVIIAGLILHSAWEVGSNAVKELIDFAPSLETIALIEEMAEEVEGVTFTHNIRIRSMGGALYVELTAETDPELTVAEGYAVIKQIREKIMDKVPNVIDVATQLTPKGEYIRQFLGSET
ncbi:MAG: cation diffusion facilitator family transporter [Gemmatimonadetes bacterium]|nr:cation diffusion facilitator family transporter [Gemmatimonadota bacterium]MDE2736427.1 cation diffusion facilitator family transporter [Gemmatimonadota bacterium]